MQIIYFFAQQKHRQFFQLSIMILTFLAVGCNKNEFSDRSAHNHARSEKKPESFHSQLQSLIPEKASTSTIAEPGAAFILSDKTLRVNISFLANSFREFVAVALEPLTSSNPKGVELAASYAQQSQADSSYHNLKSLGLFKLSAKSLTKNLDSALDFKVCHTIADYDPNLKYVAVITLENEEHLLLPAELAQGSEDTLCYSTSKANGVFELVSMEKKQPVDKTPPTDISLSFEVESQSLTAGLATIIVKATDATHMTLNSGKECNESDLIAFQEKIKDYPISLTGEVQQTLSLSVLFVDEHGNAICESKELAFVNTIAQEQEKNAKSLPSLDQVDTNPPAAPSGIINPEVSFEPSFSISWNKNPELDLESYELKLCPSDQTCRVCTSQSQRVELAEQPSAFIADPPSNAALAVCIQAIDKSGNESEWGRSEKTSIYKDNPLSSFIRRLGNTSKKIGSPDESDDLNPDGDEWGMRVANDPNNRVLYYVGTTSGNLVPGSVNIDGYDDIFALKVDYEGNILWANQVNNIEMGGYEEINAAFVDAHGDLIVAGTTEGQITAEIANSDASNDAIFLKFSQETGSVSAQQIHAASNQSIGAIKPDGKGGYYVAVIEWDNFFDQYFSIRHLSSDLKTYGSLETPWYRLLRTLTDQHSLSMDIDRNGDFIVGLTTHNLEHCAGGVHPNYTESTCGGTNQGSYASLSTNGGGKDAAVIKLSGAPESFGAQMGYFQFGAEFADSELGRDPSKDESMHKVIIHPETGDIYVQGLTLGDLTESNGGRSYGGSANDMFFARLDSQFNLIWVKHFGEDTIGAKTDAEGNHYGNIADEYTHGSLALTKDGSIMTAFSARGDYLYHQEALSTSFYSPGYRVVFMNLDQQDGSINWSKQTSTTAFSISSESDVHGNLFFVGTAMDSVFEEGENVDLLFGAITPQGDLYFD